MPHTLKAYESCLLKAVFFVALLAAHVTQAAANPNAIYRCGNDYLNDAAEAQARGCSMVESSPVTVTGTRVQSQALANSPSASPSASAAPNTPASSTPKATTWRTGSADQRARDRDALSILQAELGKAEALLAERRRELADPQRHASRLADVQSSISRHLSDIAGLKREISRLPGQSALQSTLQSK